MEFVPTSFIDLEENCSKTQCKQCKRCGDVYNIIGVRLGIVDHRNDNLQVFNFYLDESDSDAIDAVWWPLICLKLLEIAVMSIDNLTKSGQQDEFLYLGFSLEA